MQDVLFHTQGAVGIITLNRPKALNALTTPMYLAIRQQLDNWATDDTIAVVAIRGEGERAFCAGGDIRYLYQCKQEQDISLADAFIYHEYHLNEMIASYKKPFLALIHGLTMGGGIGVSIYGKRRYATDNLVWSMPETAIGLFPDIGASFFLSRLGDIGMYLALTGRRLDAGSLQAIGLVDEVFSQNNFRILLPSIFELDLAHDPLTTIDNMLRTFAKPKQTQFDEQTLLLAPYFSGDSVETIMQTLADANTDLTKEVLNDLNKRSPTSLKITFEAQKRGKHLDLKGAFAQEYSMAYRCFRTHDFFEGVRAAIIDKDGQAKWQPDTLAKVTHEDVLQYFDSPVSLWTDSK